MPAEECVLDKLSSDACETVMQQNHVMLSYCYQLSVFVTYAMPKPGCFRCDASCIYLLHPVFGCQMTFECVLLLLLHCFNLNGLLVDWCWLLFRFPEIRIASSLVCEAVITGRNYGNVILDYYLLIAEKFGVSGVCVDRRQQRKSGGAADVVSARSKLSATCDPS
jgi:hypothetical protein